MNKVKKQTTDSAPILVLGKSTTSSLGVNRAFGRRHIPVYYMCSDSLKNPVNYSRYITWQKCVPGWNQNKLISCFMTLDKLLSAHEKVVVLPSNDGSIIAYRKIREKLPARFVDAMPLRKVTDLCINKDCFYNFLETIEIPYPKSYRLNFNHPNLYNGKIQFPSVLKPTRTSPFGETFQCKLFEVNSRDELLKYSKLVAAYSIDMVVQDMIPGNSFILIYFYKSEKTSLPVMLSFRKIRQSPPDYGIGSVIEPIVSKDLLERTAYLLKKLNYNGIGEVEYKYDPRDGEYKLLELNTRPVTYNQLATQVGMDMEYLYYLDALNLLDSVPPKKVQHNHIKWIDWKKELDNWIYWRKKDTMSWKEVLNCYRHTRLDGYFATDDPLPFLRKVELTLRAGVRKAFCHLKKDGTFREAVTNPDQPTV